MKIDSLRLYNFRSYSEREFEFSDTVTVITGPNGVGKTNILEALYVLMMGKSFRDADEELIRHGEEWWRVVGAVSGSEREVRYKPGQTSPKQLLLDSQLKGRFTYRHQLPVVLFEPDDLLMLHGSPSARREYLDALLVKIEPGYRTLLGRYERALQQRNTLLKKGLSLLSLRDAVFVWDIALAEYGAEVQRLREQLVERLNMVISDVYSGIAGKTQQILLTYDAKVRGDNQRLASALARELEHDVLRGVTTVGPHRDDIIFKLNDKPVKQTASRGEVRTIVLALKDLEVLLLRDALGTTPLYLLDDVFSELDSERQKALIVASGKVQAIITTTTPETGQLLPNNISRIRLI